MGFGLVTRFIDNLQIVTTSNYNIIANVHILQNHYSTRWAFAACLH
jgi:hypothetical protein